MNKFIIIAITLILLITTTQAQFAGGDGSKADPYQISTITELDSVRHHLDQNFILMNDLDFAGTVYDSIDDNSDGWLPLGDKDNHFIGTFNGNNKSIDNLYINRPTTQYIGLFGRAANTTIYNITIIDARIEGIGNIGTLVGSLTIHDQTTTPNVISDIKIINCRVKGSNLVGGLSGSNEKTNITNCYSTGSVEGQNAIGGLVGINYYLGSISKCYSTASATGDSEIGGLIGAIEISHTSSRCYISNSYATGSITTSSSYTTSYGGGLIGKCHSSEITNCYSTGTVSVPFKTDSGILFGLNSGNSVYNCYYDSGPSGLSGSSSKTTLEMKTEATFVNWDFKSIWTIKDGVTYPKLADFDNKTNNNAPTLSATTAQTMLEDNTLEVLISMTNGADVNRNLYDTDLIVMDGANYTVKGRVVTPSKDFNGVLTVPVKISDGIDTTNSVNLIITVTPVNDAPRVQTANNKMTMLEDGTLEVLPSMIGDDIDGDELTVILAPGKNYTISGSKVTPDQNFNGVLNIPVRITDGIDTTIASKYVEIDITVVPVNDAPTLTAITDQTVEEDKHIFIELSMTDAKDIDNTLSYKSVIIEDGANYSVGSAVVPAPNFTGELKVPIRITDGIDTSASVIMTIIVTAVNDTPQITSTAPKLAAVYVPYTYIVSATDIDGDNLTYTLTKAPTGMTITDNIISWTPDAGTSASQIVSITVSDGELFITQNYTIDIETVSIEELSPMELLGNSLIVAPTPTKDSGKLLVVSDESGEAFFTIFNDSGKKIAIMKHDLEVNVYDSFSFDIIQKLPKGVYFIEMKVNGKMKAISKLVKIEP